MSLTINTFNNSCALPAKKIASRSILTDKPDSVSFKSKSESITPAENENPVNKTGEYALAISKSFYLALGTSARICLTLLDINPSMPRRKNKSMSSKDDDNGGGMDLAMIATIGVIATVATFAFVLPKAIYQANIDFFTNQKEMDVYSKDNSFKTTVYEKLDEKSKKASPQELEKLSEQALKLKMANSKAPAFIKNSQNFAARAFLKGFYLGAA